jgi:hypothetical protein
MDTSALALKLKGDGMSFRAIADRFNQESVPTPSGKGKWGHEMVKRVIANDVLTNAEVKVGLVSENEVRLKEEVESLKVELNTVKHKLSSEKTRANEWNRARDVLLVENSRLFKELDTVIQDSERLKSDIKTLTTQKDTFKSESERLNRLLSESEIKFKNQYESEITRLGSELAAANQTIQELRDKQTFLQPELVMVTQSNGVPKNYKGWTTQTDPRGYIRMFKKMSGKLHQFYLGRNWDTEKVDEKITVYNEKNLYRLKFVIRKDADEQLPVPMAPRFEDSLRMCCPEQRRTYRLDKVRMRFNGMQKSEFDRNMLSLAAEYKIELVGGDPRECDMDSLIRDAELGITYVNFEWRV